MSWFTDYNREIQKIEQGKIRPVYLLNGKEFYLVENFINILKTSFKKQWGSFDTFYYLGGETTTSQIQSSLYTTSLFQEKQILIIEGIKSLTPAPRKIIKEYLTKPSQDTVLIMTAPEIDKRNKFIAEISTLAHTVFTNPPFDNEIPQWIQAYFKDKGKSIDHDAVMELVRFSGNQMTDLANDLNNIDLFTGKSTHITIEHIRQSAGASKQFTTNDLVNAVGLRQKKQAVKILKNLIDAKTSEFYIVFSLYNLLWGLKIAKGADAKDVGMDKIARQSGFYRKNDIDNFKKFSYNYRPVQLNRGIDAIVQADENIKTKSVDSLSNMLEMLHRIMDET